MEKRLNPFGETGDQPRLSSYSREHWRLMECLKTGFVYLENPPEYEELEQTFAWERTFAEERERRRKLEPVVSRLSDASKALRKRLGRPKVTTLPAQYLRSLAPQERPTGMISLLDVGCGDGLHTVAIADNLKSSLGVSVMPVGVEISRAQAEEANRRFAAYHDGGFCIQAAGLEGLRRLPGESADLVILSSFLEHETQPIEVLKECRSKLKARGSVIIKVPNFASWNRRLRQSRWCGFRFPDHVNYFAPSTLRLALEKADLQVVRMTLLDRFPLSDSLYAVARQMGVNR